MEKFNYSIIGCGKIAGGYEDLKVVSGIYTHANAFSKTRKFTNLICIDNNYKKAVNFKNKWKFKHASNNIEFLNNFYNELIIVSSDTSAHYKILINITKLKTKPKIVLCEKPVTINYKQCKFIVDLYKKKKIHLVVNFHRRWDKTTQKISKKIHSNSFGNLQGGYCIYNKGLLNTGSHAIDLLNLFFKKFKIINVGQKIYDYNKKDPTIPFVANVDGANIDFICMKENLVNMMEIKLIFSKKILETNDGGVSWHIKANKNKNILNYDKSFYKYNFFKKTYKFTFFNMAKNIYFNLKKGKKLPCDGKNALEVHKQIKKISLNAK